jgi:hypothetical protein
MAKAGHCGNSSRGQGSRVAILRYGGNGQQHHQREEKHKSEPKFGETIDQASLLTT